MFFFYRVKSVVWSIWQEMRRLSPILIMKVDIFMLLTAASPINHLYRMKAGEENSNATNKSTVYKD